MATRTSPIPKPAFARIERSLPLTVEQRALLHLARASLGRQAGPAWPDGGGARIDPVVLLEEARRHAIGPLIGRHQDALRSLIGSDDEIITRLLVEARSATAQSLAAAAEVARILEALAGVAVRARAIKGPVGAVMCYGDVGLRWFLDLDILVDPEDVSAAVSLLQGQGYEAEFRLTPADWTRLEAHHSQLTFLQWPRRYPVDLHWRLADRGYTFTPDAKGPFARTDTVMVGSIALPTLGVEATLLHLLLHGIRHRWHSLHWICDVAGLVHNHPELDWSGILSWSDVPGRSRLVDVGLHLVSDLLEAPVPPSVLERGHADPLVRDLVERIARSLFERGPRGKGFLPETRFSWIYFQAMGTARDRALFLHDLTLRPTPHEWLQFPLPASLSPVYYVIRPFRLLAKYARLGAGGS